MNNDKSALGCLLVAVLILALLLGFFFWPSSKPDEALAVNGPAAAHLLSADLNKIEFGMTEAEVHEILGAPDEYGATRQEHLYHLAAGHLSRITYDAGGLVEDISLEVAENWFGNLNGKEMTLDDVRKLALLKDELHLDHLSNFNGGNFSSDFDTYIMVYGVERGYRLVVNADACGKIDRADLESVWEYGGTGADIRYDGLDAFLALRPVEMWTKDSTVTSSSATFVLKNGTEDTKFTYGLEFAIQQRDKDTSRWIDIEMRHDAAFKEPALILEPQQEKEFSVNWKDGYGKLPAGDYRLVKEISVDGGSGVNGSYVVFAGFTI